MKFEDELRKRWKVTGPAMLFFIILMLVAVFSTSPSRVPGDQWLQYQAEFDTTPKESSEGGTVTVGGAPGKLLFEIDNNNTLKLTVTVTVTEDKSGFLQVPDTFTVKISCAENSSYSDTKTVSTSSSEEVKFEYIFVKSVPEKSEWYDYYDGAEEYIYATNSSTGVGNWTVQVELDSAGRFDSGEISVPGGNGIIFDESIINRIGDRMGSDTEFMDLSDGFIDNSGSYSIKYSYEYYEGDVKDQPWS